MRRFLLPFTHGIDAPAITAALALAHRCDATLLLLSLIQLSPAPGNSPRLEDLQQSRDFLEFAHHKAIRLGVAVERVELHTPNTVSSIRAFAQEMACAGLILAKRRGAGVLLATHEVQQLLEDWRLPIVVLALPAEKIAPFFKRR